MQFQIITLKMPHAFQKCANVFFFFKIKFKDLFGFFLFKIEELMLIYSVITFNRKPELINFNIHNFYNNFHLVFK